MLSSRRAGAQVSVHHPWEGLGLLTIMHPGSPADEIQLPLTDITLCAPGVKDSGTWVPAMLRHPGPPWM